MTETRKESCVLAGCRPVSIFTWGRSFFARVCTCVPSHPTHGRTLALVCSRVVRRTLLAHIINYTRRVPNPLSVHAGPVVVSVSSCPDASNHPLIDALEVYARPCRAGTAAVSSPPQPSGADDAPLSTLALNTTEALEACSRLLGHALGLATTATPSVEREGEAAVSEPCRGLADSALSVLRKTCLAADTARWRALRSSSQYLLAATQPDAARRVDSVQGAYAEEILLALVGGGGGSGDGAVNARVDEGTRMSPVRLTRVAQLCRHVCVRRSMLLRDKVAPALADSCHGGIRSDGDNSGPTNRSRLQLVSRFVFPALIRRFLESCTWRRDGRDSMQIVLRCILQLAVHEMRETRAAVVAAMVTSVNSSGSGGNDEEISEQEVLRAGLGQLMPLLQSNVARVSQVSSAYLSTLLLGTVPVATDLPRPPPSASPPAVTGRRQVEDNGRTAATTASNVSHESRVNTATNGEIISSQGVVSGTYATSAGSASDAEADATSDPGTDSDADAEEERRSNVESSVQIALEGLRRAGHLSIAARRGRGKAAGGDDPPPSGQESVDPLSNAGADLAQSSVKRARTTSSAVRASTIWRDLASGRADMDVVREAADRDSSSSAAAENAAGGAGGERARGSAGGTATAARPAASQTTATTARSNASGTNAAAAASSKICYRCDGCDDFPLQHVRHHCLVCADYDLCPMCYELFHGPNSQFQGGNPVMLRDHCTAHGMVTLQVRVELFCAVLDSVSYFALRTKYE